MSQFQTLLICESTHSGTDRQLIEQLIQKYSLLTPDNYTIKTVKPTGSIEDVKGFLKLLPNERYVVSHEVKKILVIVDADENARKRFAEVKRCFSAGIFQAQQSITSTLPHSSNKINVGIYLFPDCQNPGSLETLCLKALKHNHLNLKLTCLDQYMTCIARLDSRMSQNNKSKSKFRIFMATPEPDRYVDGIIDHIDFDSIEFNGLKDFIKQAK